MANRQQRRAANKATPAYRRGETHESLLAKFAKNGITAKDYDQARQEEYERGFRDGHAQAAPTTFKMVYAAICLALNEMHRFGRKRCRNVLLRVDSHVMKTLTSAEAIQEVYERIGLHIDFDEPFDRIVEDDKK